MAQKKNRQTFEKLKREQAVREKRVRKAERKEAARIAKAAGPAASRRARPRRDRRRPASRRARRRRDRADAARLTPRFRLRRWLVPVLAVALAGSLATAVRASGTPPFKGAILTHPAAPPDIALRDQHGQMVRLSALRGKAVLLTFLYTHCPDVCPLTALNLNSALGLIGSQAKNVAVLAVSVDPQGDTPAAVRGFIRSHHLRAQFHYLTGSAAGARAGVACLQGQGGPQWEGRGGRPHALHAARRPQGCRPRPVRRTRPAARDRARPPARAGLTYLRRSRTRLVASGVQPSLSTSTIRTRAGRGTRTSALGHVVELAAGDRPPAEALAEVDLDEEAGVGGGRGHRTPRGPSGSPSPRPSRR